MPTCRSGYQKAARNFNEGDLDVDISRCVCERLTSRVSLQLYSMCFAVL